MFHFVYDTDERGFLHIKDVMKDDETPCTKEEIFDLVISLLDAYRRKTEKENKQ